MPSYTNVLTPEEVSYLSNLPEVLEAKSRLTSRPRGQVYLSASLPDSIKGKLQASMGLDLSSVSSVPMRWVKGDTPAHRDFGKESFDNTYLMYLTDSPGSLILEDEHYPITQGTVYVFNEGVNHETMNTGDEPRLLLGPMNELAQPVGFQAITYFPTEYDALNSQYSLGSNTYGNYAIGSLDVGSIGSITSWRIASNSSGTSSQLVAYSNGNVLNSDGDTAIYYLYPNIICFKEETTILCQTDGKEEYIPVEDLKIGTLVKTSLDGFKKIVMLGKGTIKNPGNLERIEDRLYKLTPSKYPALKEDLYITGCHSILEFPISDQLKNKLQSHLGKMYVTDKKYRVMAHLDDRAEPWNSEGTYSIYHFALEHKDDGMNYGVYANGGLLVESCSIRSLKNKSNMTFV